jgi:hypothetical protein
MKQNINRVFHCNNRFFCCPSLPVNYYIHWIDNANVQIPIRPILLESYTQVRRKNSKGYLTDKKEFGQRKRRAGYEGSPYSISNPGYFSYLIIDLSGI